MACHYCYTILKATKLYLVAHSAWCCVPCYKHHVIEPKLQAHRVATNIHVTKLAPNVLAYTRKALVPV